MELLIREPTLCGSLGWARTSGVLGGLRRGVESSDDVVLLSLDPLAELVDLLAAVWFFRRSGGNDQRLSVASPFPSLEWAEPLRDAGVARLFLVPWPALRGSRVVWPPSEYRDLPAGLCPALHVRSRFGGPTSVCGRHGDRLVLVARNLEQWCLLGGSGCPHARPLEAAAARQADGPPSP